MSLVWCTEMIDKIRFKRLAVFISGRGSNLVHALEAEADVRLVITNRGKAAGVQKAKRRGVPVEVFDGDWVGLIEVLKRYRVQNLFLLGFMKLLPEQFLAQFQTEIGGQILNLHPSLLPEYPGLHSIERAFADRAPIGVTIHNVIAEMDAGEVEIQRSLGADLQQASQLAAVKLWVSSDEAFCVRKVAGLR